MVKGRCWLNIPQVVQNNKDKEHLLERLEGPLHLVGFTQAAATWILMNTNSLKLETLDLIKSLQEQKIDHQDEYLELSKIVLTSQCTEDFIDLLLVN